MSLQLLFLKLKGGAGSGHWGHRGIIGERGGSARGGGLLALGLSRTSTPEERRAASKKVPNMKLTSKKIKGVEGRFIDNLPAWDESKQTTLVRQYAAAIENFQDSSGLQIKVRALYGSDNTYTVSAHIFDPTGKKVGSVDRTFYFDRNEVHHDYFSLDKEYRASGMGSRFYYASERMYPSMGIDKVSILANIDVGGYAWARMGYDFNSPMDSDRVMNSLRRVYVSNYSGGISDLPSKPWEIAAFKGPDGRRLGKEVLLKDGYNHGWHAIKNLNASDEGYRAGLEYYKQKGVL